MAWGPNRNLRTKQKWNVVIEWKHINDKQMMNDDDKVNKWYIKELENGMNWKSENGNDANRLGGPEAHV